MEYLENKFGAVIPKEVTKSYHHFVSELQQSEFLILMFAIGGEYIFHDQETVKEKLKDIYSDPNNEASNFLIKQLESNELNEIFDIRTYEHFYGQMCYARTIDNVQTYFKEILSEVIHKKPQILKSNETETHEFILNCNNMNELLTLLANKKVRSLFYGGIKDIESFFQKRLGIDIFKRDEDRQEFNQAVKNRNLIVHNRGIVTKEYLDEFPHCPLKEGDSLKFTYEDISRVNLILSNFIAFLDDEVADKYHLDKIKYM